MIDDILKYFTGSKRKRKSPEKKIRDAYRQLPKHLRNRALDEAVGEIVDLAISEFEKGRINSAAENFELAADAYETVSGKRDKNYRKYRDMAQQIRKSARKSRLEKDYVPDYQIALIGVIAFFLSFLSFSFRLTGNVVGNINSTINIFRIFLIIVSITSFLIWIIRKKK